MKLSAILLSLTVLFFGLSSFADDDFSDSAPAAAPSTAPGGEMAAPPSGEFNKEVNDAAGHEEPKVPQPESAKKPAHKHSAKKEKAAKHASKSKKSSKSVGKKKKKHKKSSSDGM